MTLTHYFGIPAIPLHRTPSTVEASLREQVRLQAAVIDAQNAELARLRAEVAK